MLKFEAKKGDFANIWQKLGGYCSAAHASIYPLTERLKGLAVEMYKMERLLN